jgi:hypothetical protein
MKSSGSPMETIVVMMPPFLYPPGDRIEKNGSVIWQSDLEGEDSIPSAPLRTSQPSLRGMVPSYQVLPQSYISSATRLRDCNRRQHRKYDDPQY